MAGITGRVSADNASGSDDNSYSEFESKSMDASRSARRRSDSGEVASAAASEARYSETFAEETMQEASSAAAADNTNATSASRPASGSMYSDSFPQESAQDASQKKSASPNSSGSKYSNNFQDETQQEASSVQKKSASPKSSASNYSDNFQDETQQEASSVAQVAGSTSKSPSQAPSKAVSENQYSDDDFEDDPEDAGNDDASDDGARGRVMDMSQLQAANSSPSPSVDNGPSGRIMDMSQLQAATSSPSPPPVSSARPTDSSQMPAIEEFPGDPHGVRDRSQLTAVVGKAEVAHNDFAPPPHVHSSASSCADATRPPGVRFPVPLPDHCEPTRQHTNLPSDPYPRNAISAAVVTIDASTSPPAVASADASTSPRVHDFSELTRLGLSMPPASYLVQEGLTADPDVLPATSFDRRHDAIPRHFKAHAWDLASLGQPGYPELLHRRSAAGVSDAQHRQQPPLAPGAMELRGGGGRGFGGEQGPLASGVERQLVERLAQRFVLDRKAPSLEQRERLVYRDMMQQVAWTALEQSAAQEAAQLLSKRWLAPVSSTEALRAFRRSLHAVLTDDRVIDIVEHQMAAHFGGRHQAPAR